MTIKKTILKAINTNSLQLYYLLTENKIKIEDIYKIIVTGNKDLLTGKKLTIPKSKLNELKKDYTKYNCLDEILYLTNKKYKHLKEIRYIVNINSLVEEVVTDKIYLEKLKVHYTDLIIDLLIESFYDYKSLKYFSLMRQYLIKIDSDINYKIIENIDKFYIKRITI